MLLLDQGCHIQLLYVFYMYFRNSADIELTPVNLLFLTTLLHSITGLKKCCFQNYWGVKCDKRSPLQWRRVVSVTVEKWVAKKIIATKYLRGSLYLPFHSEFWDLSASAIESNYRGWLNQKLMSFSVNVLR